ncbi:heptaprenyl diphosphate synthase component I [Candidatus Vecturithrix granuli]|uniref:Heptaprenyl diphosphate synthase component I n=1 Tax=Vecturithrix granuli TaxID=1499967 RepID=A0A081C9C9_VECG1|nr:heptaprenyl diphosphate synthase component I [Candidatus Vecturithrix granuli]
MKETRELVLLSLLVALAVVLRGLEGLIPSPLPWVRIGLANIMTLLAILLFGLKAGMLLTILRILIASLLLGTFLSPTFLISLIAGICSTLVMGAVYLMFRSVFSPIGISVLGGFIHNLAQLLTVYILVVKHLEIFYLFPILSVIGIISGFFNGWVVAFLYERLHEQMERLLPSPQKAPV